MSGEKQLWQRSTRDNALFLSTAVQLNSEQLQPVFDWFKTTLRLSNVGGWAPTFSASLCENNEKSKVMAFLHAADIHINDVLIEKKTFDADDLPADMPAALRNAVIGQMKDKKTLEIKMVHEAAMASR